MKAQKRRNLWLLGMLFVVTAAVVVIVWNREGIRREVAEGRPSLSLRALVSSNGKSSGVAAYQQALTKYAASRIQFDATCNAYPKSVTFKSGTTAMLDNRADVTRVITFDSKQYTIAPLGYAVVSLSSTRLPRTYYVDCDQQKNVLTVMLQK